MMKKHLLSVLAFFLIVCQSAFAQQRTITGVVTDENNEPLVGVAVLLQGSVSVGTITELDGTYSISVPSSGAVLQFSSLGYLTQTVPVGQSNNINVSLALDNMQLQETVVVGFVP